MSDQELAAKLKEEGNKCYANKEFSQAYDKYTKAIKINGENAILYANRSACSISLGRYLDAATDAKKATELDPAYVKGWGRLASAEQELGSWERAAEAYETALKTLPKKSLSAAEKKQKDQYEDGLRLVNKKMEPRDLDGLRSPASQQGQRPWDRAKALIEAAQQNGTDIINSSANVILMAYDEFMEGNLRMSQQFQVQLPDGRTGMCGVNNVIECTSNAILRDRRAFHLTDPQWVEKYNKQVIIEMSNVRAWPEAGPEVVLSEAQQRVKEHGWDDVRPALSLTVRAWIMRAFLVGGTQQNHASAVQFYGNAIDVLTRGRTIWADVSKEDRGVIFEDTFLRGVRAMQLEAFMQAHASTGGRDPRFNLDTLGSLAFHVYTDAEAARKEVGYTYDGDPGSYLSFYIYPAAEALAIKAYCQKMKARGKSPVECSQLFGESALFYRDAALKLPEDDEYYCGYLMNSLGSWWMFDDLPLKNVLPILEKLKNAAPKMKKIWEISAFAMQGRDRKLKKCLDFYEEIQRKMESEVLTEDQTYNPPFQI